MSARQVRRAIAALVLTYATHATADARVVVLDDGERVARDVDRALPPTPWPDAITLFAMRGETIALQVVVEAGAREASGVHALVGSLARDDGPRLDARVDLFAERFVEIARPSGNERAPGSLAFSAKAAPGIAGWVADALIPFDVAGDLRIAPHTRGAIWIDLAVPTDARDGTYRGAILVRDDSGEIASRALSVRVLDRDLPYAAAKVTTYYDRAELTRRMGDAAAERDLRQLLHAHHLSAIHDAREVDALDREALRGELFTEARGYRGPGIGVGEGVFAIGAYGALGEPRPEALATAERAMKAVSGVLAGVQAQSFVYAVDEECDSPWGGRWMDLARHGDGLRGVRIGVTCGRDPIAQAADLVMLTAEDYVPARARAARGAAKWVWAYNGRRPFAGPMMLDVPATDLRANAWIAARYGVARWFYWESTFWFDGNRGGRGGEDGFDPFVIAETFHDADGDWANGDGILVYPGTQKARGMIDYGVASVFPSVRLKNLRRGIEDAAYIGLARAIDREAADAIVRRMIPRALALAPEESRAAWPERGAAWLEARRALVAIVERVEHVERYGSAAQEDAESSESVRARDAMSDGCAVKSSGSRVLVTSAAQAGALFLIVAFVRRLRKLPCK